MGAEASKPPVLPETKANTSTDEIQPFHWGNIMCKRDDKKKSSQSDDYMPVVMHGSPVVLETPSAKEVEEAAAPATAVAPVTEAPALATDMAPQSEPAKGTVVAAAAVAASEASATTVKDAAPMMETVEVLAPEVKESAPVAKSVETSATTDKYAAPAAETVEVLAPEVKEAIRVVESAEALATTVKDAAPVAESVVALATTGKDAAPAAETTEAAAPASAPDPARVPAPLPVPVPVPEAEGAAVAAETMFVTLHKPDQTAKLGLILNTVELKGQDQPSVAALNEDGIASKAGVLKLGDVVLKVNNQPVTDHNQATGLMKQAAGAIVIEFYRAKEGEVATKEPETPDVELIRTTSLKKSSSSFGKARKSFVKMFSSSPRS